MSNKAKPYLAFDLGASSGRAVLGFIDKNKLEIEEINRFSNDHIEIGDRLVWDFVALWKNIVDSLKVCSESGYKKLNGIGIDTWGVDFGLIGKDGQLIGEPICYRDGCTEGMDKFINSKISQRKMYDITGFTVSRVGTLPQLVALRRGNGADRLKITKNLLMMPDMFRYFLGGASCTENTIAGTSLVYDINKNCWSNRIIREFGLPAGIFPKIVKPATITGKLKQELADRYDLNKAPIIAVVGHDTPSAFSAAPYSDEDTIIISCGTWSVVGRNFKKPILTDKAFKSGFINEPGFESVLFVQNLMGLYLFENLKRQLESKGHKTTYPQMISLARKAKPFENFLYTSSPMLFAAKEPLELVKEYLKKTGQKTSNTGRIIRLLLEGLAFSYKSSIDKLKEITGRDYKRICMVGGGIRNTLLCQMAADATGLEVVAGPAEATITGNFAIQSLATNKLKSSTQIRKLVKNSFAIKTYRPKGSDLWDSKYKNYKSVETKSLKLK